MVLFKDWNPYPAMLVKPFWQTATWLGTRRLGRLLLPSRSYDGTLCYFDWPPPVAIAATTTTDQTPPTMVALTIDDGLSRGGVDTSMVPDVLQLLEEFGTTATFFVCTDYVSGCEDQVRCILESGHELGNHLQADKVGYYSRLSKDDFRQSLLNANEFLDCLEENSGINLEKRPCYRWFRPPQGIMTPNMKQVLQEEQLSCHQLPMQTILGDCYCDDWLFAESLDGRGAVGAVTGGNDLRTSAVMQTVATIMLQQAQGGSIAIFHMPERGFRQATLSALRLFLQGLQAKGWKCCSLSDMARLINVPEKF